MFSLSGVDPSSVVRQRPRQPLRPLAALALALVLGVPARSSGEARRYTLEVGAGAFIPLAEEHRDDYGAGAALAFGATSQLTPSGVWLLLDVGVVRNRGQELATDPTFALEEATLWLVPIRVGVRRDLVPPTYDGFPRVYLGVAFQSMWTSSSIPLVETQSSAAFGVSFEIHADVAGNDRWRLWVRQTAALSSSVRIAPVLRRLDTTGAQLMAGLGYTLN